MGETSNGGTDLGGLAHLLLKLAAHAVVLLDAQRERLGRFFRLQLRLVRGKRKTMAFSGLTLIHKPAERMSGNNSGGPVIAATALKQKTRDFAHRVEV